MEKHLLDIGFKKIDKDSYYLFSDGLTINLNPLDFNIDGTERSIVDEKIADLRINHGDNDWLVMDNFFHWATQVEGFDDNNFDS